MHGALARRLDHQESMRWSPPNGNPIVVKLREGQAHDGRSAAALLETMREGQVLLTDRGYDSDALRAAINSRGA